MPTPRPGSRLRSIWTEAPRVTSATAASCVAVALSTLIAYAPALRNGFVWNDADYVTRTELQTFAGLRRIWCELGATEQYYPLLHSAFWIEHRMWGDAPWAYHLVNVLLHAASACLLYLLLLRTRLLRPFTNDVTVKSGASSGEWKSAFGFEWLAAMLFALHPLCVESVAWISEQKNTLSTLFFLAAALAYLRWRALASGPPADDRSRANEPVSAPISKAAAGSPAAAYGVATLLFVLALLSKSATSTLPAVLLVLIWLREGRLRWKIDWLPLLPWLGMGAAMGLFTGWVERTYVIGEGGARLSLGPPERILIAGRAAWFYLGKLLWPHPLVFFYPAWRIRPDSFGQWIWPIAGVCAVAALWTIRGKSRGPLAASLLFLGTLAPALGFFDVYAFRFSFVADHFAYIACLVFCAAISGGCRALPSPFGGAAIPGIACVLVLCGALTSSQCRRYRDPEVFYRSILDRNPGSWIAHNNLGNWLILHGRADEAVAHERAALAIKPDYPEAENDLGVALEHCGRPTESLTHYETAVRLNPAFENARCNLGRSLLAAGRTEEAAVHLEYALRLRPDDSDALGALVPCLYGLGRVSEAITYCEDALRIRPDDSGTLNNLGGLLMAAGRMDEAIGRLRASIALDPGFPQSHTNLAAALASLGRTSEAAAEVREASRLQAVRSVPK